MTLNIGSRPLTELSQTDLLNIVLIIQCCPSLEFWKEPEISDFSNKTFSDTYVLHYHSFRKEDNLKSSDYIFFFDFKRFCYHYSVDFHLNKNQPSNGRAISFEIFRYLIKQGFYIPFDDDNYKTTLR